MTGEVPKFAGVSVDEYGHKAHVLVEAVHNLRHPGYRVLVLRIPWHTDSLHNSVS